MNGLLEQVDEAAGSTGLRFADAAATSIFDVTAFIDEADFDDEDPLAESAFDGDEPLAASWQNVVGRRLLTATEQAARERYFDRKAAVGIAGARRLRRGAA